MKPYLSDIINDRKIQGEWKIHLTMATNLFSSKDSEETRTMHSNNNNIEVIMGDETDKIIIKTFLILFYKDTKKI